MIKGEKGFTLVELLAVIVILGIIVAIAIPAIGNVIKNAKTDANKQEVALIIDAARLYEIREYKGAEDDFSVTVTELMEKNYLDERQGKVQDGTVTRNAAGELEFTAGDTTPDDTTPDD